MGYGHKCFQIRPELKRAQPGTIGHAARQDNSNPWGHPLWVLTFATVCVCASVHSMLVQKSTIEKNSLHGPQHEVVHVDHETEQLWSVQLIHFNANLFTTVVVYALCSKSATSARMSHSIK